MNRFHCKCGSEVFFDNTYCSQCGGDLGFNTKTQQLHSIYVEGDKWVIHSHQDVKYKVCEHRHNQLQCNWLIPAESTDNQCLACASTRTIPSLEKKENWWRWRSLESTKRRLFYSLLRLNLPIDTRSQGHEDGLSFDFLEDQRSNPLVAVEHIYTGHNQGLITLNVAEADSSYREATREAMNEPYRTLLGHFRHEIGHFYWDRLIKDKDYYAQFQKLFGDETVDYRSTVDFYYENGPLEGWQKYYISSYASAHPLEDWAETWSHYLLMIDTLETALSYELIPKLEKDWLFDVWISEWVQLAVVLNALNRSTGNADAYPFVISDTVKQKLKFIHELMFSFTLIEVSSAWQ